MPAPQPSFDFRSAFDVRNRLMALVQQHPLMARHDPPLPGEFPHDILPYDPGTVNQAEDVQAVMTVQGQNFDPFSIGGNGVGQITLTASVVVLVYVANTPQAQAKSPEDWLTNKMEREAYLGQLTTTLLQAIFSYPVDPGPDAQYWNVMKLVPTLMHLHTTFYATDVFHQSKTRLHLSGQMYRPLTPSGKLSTA